ncbi:TetR/AcrR family transcriptional regulator [Actinomadura logoneensis]|uniref:TetR/AcrR family transcriptional regulator n=1 Tax=Actinomadura logoneensis TaxID=2293572 RepID=A0A372JQ92_9ACTN|nr:ScbR family autoregulator-binding transcription factor [Actinomadura logoneensis]RFU42119.1 TetR/AcrR family transcriptional regulator [Actinomadura logoneensis]
MQERARRTRETILRAAAAAFEANGYGATTLQEITRHEDVSKGALYFHFPDKETLAATIVAEYDALWRGLLAELRPRHPRALVLLVEFSWAVGLAFRDNPPARAGIRLLLETRLYESHTRPPHTGWIAETAALLAEAGRQGDLAPGVNTADVARFVVATFTGLQQIVILDGGPADPVGCVTTMWRCLLPGLVPPERLPGLLDLLDTRGSMTGHAAPGHT